MAYEACWVPSVTYSLGMTTISAKALKQEVQLQSIGGFLNKMGFIKQFSQALAFGPYEMGGMAFSHLSGR